jgi:hypothetical protein
VPEQHPAERPGHEPDRDVPNAAMVPATGSIVGKNSLLKTRAAAVPLRKMSYHSMAVPMKLAATTRATDS